MIETKKDKPGRSMIEECVCLPSPMSEIGFVTPEKQSKRKRSQFEPSGDV